MKIDETSICRFENKPENITVGNVFEMHCEWPLSVMLSSPVRIEFDQQDKKERGAGADNPPGPYALLVLKTINIYPGKGFFKVTSYQPGYYNTGFKIVSDEGVVEVKPLSWKVDSVIPRKKKETIQPYPPYGPWKEPLPIWYWPISVLTLLSLILFIVFKIRLVVKRKRKIQEVNKRLQNKKPLREFISQLNLLARGINTKERTEIIGKLETAFRFFLENQFFISALNETPKKMARQLKRYYPVIYKECDILNFFSEMKKLSSEKMSLEDFEQLLNMARDMAVSCLEKIQERS